MRFTTHLRAELLGKLSKQSRLPRFKLLEPLVLELHDDSITVPTGFTTDLASIPWFLHWLFTPWDGVARRPAVIHDWLYKNSTKNKNTYLRKRKGCDILLHNTILSEGGSKFRAAAYYRAVRLFGHSRWNNN